MRLSLPELRIPDQDSERSNRALPAKKFSLLGDQVQPGPLCQAIAVTVQFMIEDVCHVKFLTHCIAFVSVDLDLYTSTEAALHIFEAATQFPLPRIPCYLDDIIGFTFAEHNGERGSDDYAHDAVGDSVS